MSDQIPQDIQALSFEEALKQLEDTVQRLESGQVSLEQSIEAYTRGTQLKAHCEAKLKAAQDKVEKIVAGANGALSAESFHVE